MGNLCCKPSTPRRKSETDFNSGCNNIFLQSFEPEATNSCDFCPFLKMQEFEAASDIKVKVDVTKGSLLSENISFWLKSPKNGAKTVDFLK